MFAAAQTQHPPAIRVGGRRLSMPSRPKPVMATDVEMPNSPVDVEPVDYPRPAPPGEEHHPHTEEEAPKKEKKQGHDSEHRLRESAMRKVPENRPTKEIFAGGKTVGGGGRISQPTGRMFA
ncbi:hypothetical protein OF83DRAFT_1100613 [Amylostereum chailletii]|nr:hypothetical protein OF83DRAFT_1100613 [Amylostereum chailletii]